MIEWIGWIGTAFAILGIWLVSHKLRVGFIVGIISCIFWAVKGVYTSQADLITVELLIILTQLHAWRKWGNDARTDLGETSEPVR